MGLQKFRADKHRVQSDGAKVWVAKWNGGETISMVYNCRLVNLEGDMRRCVYATGEPDTWFSIPAVTVVCGCRVTGVLAADDDGCLVFRQCYY